jgi:hypothetical protein
VAGNEDLDGWWEGLSGRERAEAERCREADQLNDAVRESLGKAGVTESGDKADRRVMDYLKMRHRVLPASAPTVIEPGAPPTHP